MKNRLITIQTLNITGWALYTILLLIFFSNLLPVDKAIFRTIELIAFQSALFYLNALLLMPKLLEKQKYVRYSLAITTLILLGALALYYLDFTLKPFGDITLKGRGPREILNNDLKGSFSASAIHWRGILRNILSLFAITLISIISRMFYQKSVEEKKEASLKHENLMSEMKFLKSQVNPHFLFNALNNIYTLVLLKHDNAPAMLLKLSDMLRYMLYECNDDLAPIEKEISYINNFIELQQLKTEETQNIETDFHIEESSAMIPPLLLIPFVENSFKHGNIDDSKNGWIKIHLTATKEQLYFSISNSIPENSIAKDKTKGIGLENVKRRLELMYPDKYKLNIKNDSNIFNVELTIFSV